MLPITKYLIVVLIASMSLVGAFLWHKTKMDAYSTKVKQEVHAEYNQKIVKLQQEVILAQQELQQGIHDAQQEKQKQVDLLNRKHSNALTSLLNDTNARFASSPGSSGSSTSNPESRATVPQRGLTREDASFLAGYSERSERLRLELIACYKQYDEVRNSINKANIKSKE